MCKSLSSGAWGALFKRRSVRSLVSNQGGPLPLPFGRGEGAPFFALCEPPPLPCFWRGSGGGFSALGYPILAPPLLCPSGAVERGAFLRLDPFGGCGSSLPTARRL